MSDPPPADIDLPSAVVLSPDGAAPSAAGVGQALLLLAVLQAADAVVLTDADGIVVAVNRVFERLTGYTPADVIGLSADRLAPAGTVDGGGNRDRERAMRCGRVWRGEVVRQHRDGSPLVWEETLSPVRDEAGQVVGFLAIGQDAAARRELEGRRRQALKMEAIGRLAGGVAHDFNNLLTVINAYAQQLVAGLEEGSRLAKGALAIMRSADRATALTGQLLAFSRRQLLTMRIVDLNVFLANLERAIRQTVGGGVEVVVEVADGVVPINVDVQQLERVVLEFAANSRDAMPEGGVFRIRTAVVDLDQDFVAAHVGLQPGRYAMLSARDTGCGMDVDTQSRLFEPFFTTKAHGRGKGLGLAMAFGFIKQSEGYVWVESAPGQGTTITVYFPHAESVTRPAAASADAGEAPGHRGTIMVVEDEDDVRHLLADVLSRSGYRVLDAGHGPDALRLAEQHDGRIDLVISDMVMPQMDGWEVARRMAVLRPEAKVLFMSGYSADVSLARRLSTSQVAFLSKPFTPTALRLKVRTLLAGSDPPDSPAPPHAG